MHKTRWMQLSYIVIPYFTLSSNLFSSDGTNISPLAVTRGNIIMVDSGIMDFPNTSNGTFTTNVGCPLSTDDAYVTIAINKIQNQFPATISACVTGTTGSGPYVVNFTTSQLYSASRTTGGNVSLSWTLYCYPAGKPRPSYDTTCLPPGFDYTVPSFFLDEGYLGAARANPGLFMTNKRCPPGYNPSITMIAYEVDSSHCGPGAWGTSAILVSDTGTNYFVTYRNYKECYDESDTWYNDTHVRWQLHCIRN